MGYRWIWWKKTCDNSFPFLCSCVRRPKAAPSGTPPLFDGKRLRCLVEVLNRSRMS